MSLTHRAPFANREAKEHVFPYRPERFRGLRGAGGLSTAGVRVPQSLGPARVVGVPIWQLASLPSCLMFLSHTRPLPSAATELCTPRAGGSWPRGLPTPPELLPCPQVVSLKKQLDQEVPRRQRTRLGQASQAKQ